MKSQQEIFDFESVSDRPKFTIKQKEYIVYYWKVVVEKYVGDDESYYDSWNYGRYVDKTYSEQLGVLDASLHKSYSYALYDELKEQIESIDPIKYFGIPAEEKFKSSKLNTYREYKKEFIVS